MKTIIKFIIFNVLFSSFCFAEEINKNREPLSKAELIHYELLADGGTTGFIIKDKEGKEIQFCFDGRISSNTKGQLYIGNEHPLHATLVSKNSKESEMLINLLQESLQNLEDENIKSIIENKIKKYQNS